MEISCQIFPCISVVNVDYSKTLILLACLQISYRDLQQASQPIGVHGKVDVYYISAIVLYMGLFPLHLQ
jgi:hypothetical protein